MVRNAQPRSSFGGIKGIRGLDDVKLYEIVPPISEERWEPRGARNIEAVVLHTREHLDYFHRYADINAKYDRVGLEYVDRLNDDPSDYLPETVDYAPWGMHYFISRNGDIYKCMNERDIAYGVEMRNIVGARESRIIGGRMKVKELEGLDEGGFTDTDSEGSETDEEGRVLNAGYYVYTKEGEFQEGDSFNFFRQSKVLPVIGVETDGDNPNRRYVVLGNRLVALERDGRSGRVDESRSATISTVDRGTVSVSVTDDFLFLYNQGGHIAKYKRESNSNNAPSRLSLETARAHNIPQNIIAGVYTGKNNNDREVHYLVDALTLRVYVVESWYDTDTGTQHTNVVRDFRLQERNRHPASIYVSGNRVYIYDSIDHQVYQHDLTGAEIGFATYDLPVTHSSYSSRIVITDDKIYVVANAISFETEGLRNPHELRITVTQSAVRSILEQDGIELAKLDQDTQNRLTASDADTLRGDALTYKIVVHDIDWSIPSDEQFIRGTGSVTGVIEHLREFINSGVFILEDDGFSKLPKYSAANGGGVVEKFLNLPNQSQIRIEYEHFSDSIRSNYEYSDLQDDLDTSDELIGRFIISFGSDFTIGYVNPLYNIRATDLTKALRIHTDGGTSRGVGGRTLSSNELGVVTEIGSLGNIQFNKEEPRTPGWPPWFDRQKHRTWNNPTLNVMLDIRITDIPRIQRTAIWRSLVSLIVNFKDRNFIPEINNQRVVGHHQIISPWNDPGDSFPWGSLFDDAADLMEENEEEDTRDVQETPPEDENTRDAQYNFIAEEDGFRRLRNRRVFFEVGLLNDEERTFAVSSEDGLRIKFFVDYNLNSQPQASTLDIYNLSESTRETMVSNSGFYRLYAGYEDELLLLKTGVVAAVQNVWSPPNWITTFLLAEPDYGKGLAHISRSWESAPLREIIEDIAIAMGVVLDDTNHLVNFNQSFTFTYSGPPRQALNKLLEFTDYSYSIEGGQLFINNKYKRQFQPQNFEFNDELYDREQARREAEQKRGIAYNVNIKTGMIGKPGSTENGVDVKIRLTGGISVTDNIRIESEEIQGVYNVYGVSYVGDTWEGMFETRVKTMPITGGSQPTASPAQIDTSDPNAALDAEFAAELEDQTSESE